MATPTRVDALGFVVGRLTAIEDPRERMRALAAVLAELDNDDRLQALRRTTALELRSRGLYWREIGELLGVTAQRAHEIANESPKKEGTQDGQK